MSSIIYKALEHFTPGVPLGITACLCALVMLGLGPLEVNDRMRSGEILVLFVRRTVYAVLVVLVLWLGLVVAATSSAKYAAPAGYWDSWLDTWPWVIGCGILASIMFKLGLARYVTPALSNWWRRLWVVQRGEKLSDIRAEMLQHKNRELFLPESYYRPGQFFVGLKDGKDGETPVYISAETWTETNKMAVGPTRFGKGVSYQIAIQQHIRAGHNVFFIDPKGDKFIPKLMEAEAAAAGKKFFAIDLTEDNTPPYYAPFVGGSERDKFARFSVIMKLAERGTDADHYKAVSRSQFAKIFASLGKKTQICRINAAVQRAGLDDDQLKAMSTAIARLEEWGARKKLDPGKSVTTFSIERALKTGAIVYVKGSQDDPVARQATQAMLVELLQEIKRLAPERDQHTAICVDELSFLVNEAVTDALATILGYNASMYLAFQSFGDLLNPDDRTLDGRAIDARVKTNCQVKLIFGGSDAETAKYVSELSGTRLKEVSRSENLTVNAGGGETWDGTRMLNEVEEALITPNKVLTLPRMTAALYQPNKLASVIRMAFVPVDLDARPAETVEAKEGAA